MALLGAFDSVFSEEALYLSEDSLSAMYDAGTMNYVECQLECSTLPGQWKMPRLNEVQVANQAMWIETSQREVLHTGSYFNVKYLTPEGHLDDEDLSYNRACFCVTKERPRWSTATALEGHHQAKDSINASTRSSLKGGIHSAVFLWLVIAKAIWELQTLGTPITVLSRMLLFGAGEYNT